ncbi:hypothetical protein [Liquorilactobacillus mali]|uniref:DNA-directed RNA polymerase beta subunit n=2 Tax=Liquorilactobacillus mali TaxID=1618 RepID=A0A0R2E5A0_9LACO|nr:hypothetical protein [Liquorilactobacillus mali]KRN10379.1 hypothetical protein FD00_GL000144 [Liquorilactobacillus mali KCTC 3596 = DSM 20444]KRN27005.1 hypothetical protein IV36_GL001260 [Liquorilactobacillus mali]MDC7952705.1 hypothetical protein [Liquorilactobacillus mali]MDN7144972.1 hypothetical protein [Liquorilactobacillus mali]
MNDKEKIDDAFAEYFFKNFYQDRGMRKWQGFFLSDHTQALKKQRMNQEKNDQE